jgi:starch synthase
VPIHTTHDEGLYKHTTIDGVGFFFVSSDYYFTRSGPIYGHGDEFERFGLFQLATLEFLRYHDYDVVHCHDWHTGLLPYMIHVLQQEGLLSKVKTIFTIHNLAFQGVFELEYYKTLFLPYSNKFEMHGLLNFMKTGIMSADIVTTVSPTYAKEILQEEYGEGLHDILWMRKEDLHGIVNGLDIDIFNPRTDAMIATYDGRSVTKGKRENKHRLQSVMGLPQQDCLMIGVVSRLSHQKGWDLLERVIPLLLEQHDIQMVVIGSGDQTTEMWVRELEKRFPTTFRCHIGYSEPRARLVYAGSDLFLMPSRYEPCGLAQMIAMRYGSLPVVRHTGGLADTVKDHTEGGVGFVFHDYESSALQHAIEQAIYLYHHSPEWKNLVRSAMKEDFSWNRSATKYEAIYRGK